MTDPMEDLIREIAAKHGVALSRDDPIMVLQTLNHRLIADSAKAQQVQLDLYKEEMEAAALRWSRDAKGKSERILNATLSASKEAMASIMQEEAKTLAAAVRQEFDAAHSGLTTPIQDARRIAVLNVVASCITLLAVVLIL